MRIVWSPLTVECAIEGSRYIAADDAQAAQAWVERLFARVERLSRFPQSGRLVPELRRADIREIIHGGYRVIYFAKIEKGLIWMLTMYPKNVKDNIPANILRQMRQEVEDA